MNESTANRAREVEVGPEDLPLHCPLPSMTLWNAHPRVFLPIEKTGEALCPYCGMRYTLRRSAGREPRGAFAPASTRGAKR